MSQRDKARDFLRREGHGAAVADMTTKPGSKRAIVDRAHPGVDIPTINASHSPGMLDEDGLLQGGVGDI